MAYNFLGLVNDIGERLNEIQLTSANFSAAVGVHASMKQAINSSVNRINRINYQWPFNFSLQSDTLTAGDMRYSYPATAKFVDFNTFRIQRDATIGNTSRKLRQVDYEQYLSNYIDDEHNSSETGIRSIPQWVSRAPSQEYTLAPAPDEAYTLDYEVYSLPTALSAYDDVPTIPSDSRDVIVDGAMYFMHLFNGDHETADRLDGLFKDNVNDMRKLYTNRYEYVRDTRVPEVYNYRATYRTDS